MKALKVICPAKYRIYADRVENNVPIFKESLTVHYNRQQVAATNFLGVPAPEGEETADAPAAVDGDVPPPPAPFDSSDDPSVDVPITVSSDPVEDDEVVRDDEEPYIYNRSMSKRELILEASSIRHLMSHHPHNPYCRICREANMRQRRYARTQPRDDDGLPAPTKKNQL